MTTGEIRSDLKSILDRITDDSALQALRTLALRTAEQDEMAAEMNRMADLSEADIKAGRVHTQEEVEAWLKERRGK